MTGPDAALTAMIDLLRAARAVVTRHHHVHTDHCRGAYSPCGEHHMHDMTCGDRPLICRRAESSDEVNSLHRALSVVEHRVVAEALKDQGADLRELQRRVKESWTLATYSETFLAAEAPHRDFAHALLHVTKAAGKIAAAVDAGDHSGDIAAFKPTEINRFVADLVVCALRMANTCPVGEIDLQRAVEQRIDQNAGPAR